MLTELLVTKDGILLQFLADSNFPLVPTCTAPIPLSFTAGWVNNPASSLDDPVLKAMRLSRTWPHVVTLDKIFQNQPPSTTRTIKHGTMPKMKRVIPVAKFQQFVALARALFGGSADFYSALGMSPRFRKFREEEHDVHHVTFKGSVVSGSTSLFSGDDPTFPNHYYPKLTIDVPYPGGDISSWTPYAQTMSGRQGGSLTSRLAEVKEAFVGNLVQTSSRVQTTLSSLEWSVSELGLVTQIRYSGTNFIRTNSSFVYFRVDFDYILDFIVDDVSQPPYEKTFPLDGVSPELFPILRVTGIGSTKSYFKNKVWTPTPTPYTPNEWTTWDYGHTGLVPPAPTSAFYGEMVSGVHYNPSALPVNSESSFMSVRKRSLTNSTAGDSFHLLNDFWRQTSSLWIHLLGLLAVTGQEAVGNATLTLESNNIENLAQIEGLLDFAEFGLDVAKLLVLVREGTLFRAGIALLDLLSDAYLLYSFGLLPSIMDAIDFVTKSGQLVDALRHLPLGTYFTGHGSTTYVIPDDGFVSITGLVVHARSALRFNWSDTTLCSLMLPAKMFGVIPSLAFFWDLVPGSFLLDRVTNLGGKFELIDSQSQAILLEIAGCVSSLELVKSIPAELLAEYGITPLSNPRVVAYERIVEPTFPAMHDSRYDFNPPPPIGGFWKIGIALLWGILRS
jgi:hypothetical protein